MTIKVPKPEVLQAAFAHMAQDLHRWDQRAWVINWDAYQPAPTCGTTACLAGHILLASGTSWTDLLGSHGVAFQAMEALGFTYHRCDCSVRCTQGWGWDGAEFLEIFYSTTSEDGAFLGRKKEFFEEFKGYVSAKTGIEL